MRTSSLIVIIVVAIVIVAAGAWFGLGYAFARGDGPIVSEDREVTGFSKVEVSGSGTLIVSVGDTPGLRVDAQRNVLDRLEANVSGDTLRIRQRWAWPGIGPWWGQGDITYHLMATDLSGIKLSGSIRVRGEDALEGEELVIDASGSATIDLEVRTETLRVDTSGSADLRLRGDVGTASFDTSGSARIAARDLVSGIVRIDSSGSSRIEVNASERLTVRASGSSRIAYLGDPTLDTSISGSGEVRRLEP